MCEFTSSTCFEIAEKQNDIFKFHIKAICGGNPIYHYHSIQSDILDINQIAFQYNAIIFKT